MMEFLSTYRYAFLIGTEIVFWVMLSSFFISRYIFRLEKASIFILPIILLNELFIAFLAYIDYRFTGQFSTYQSIVIILILYSLIYGKKDFQRLDYWLQKQIAKWRGEPAPLSPASQKELYGRAYAMKGLKEWSLHLLLYLSVLIILAFTVGLSNKWLNDPIVALEKGVLLFQNEQASQIFTLWSLILMIDAIIMLSYFIFPKKKKLPSSPSKNQP